MRWVMKMSLNHCQWGHPFTVHPPKDETCPGSSEQSRVGWGVRDVCLMHQRGQLIFKSESTDQRPTDGNHWEFSFKVSLVWGITFSPFDSFVFLFPPLTSSVLLLQQRVAGKLGSPPPISGKGLELGQDYAIMGMISSQPNFSNTSAPNCITGSLFSVDRAEPWLTWAEKAGIW